LWATQKLLPLKRGGEFAKGLERGREAALRFSRALEDSGKFAPAFEPELDIVVFVPNGGSLEEISAKSRRIFDSTARQGLHLAVAELPVKFWGKWRPAGSESGGTAADELAVTCLRSVLMKPEHLEWIERIMETLETCSRD
jgi:tyrosine decarboxylase / aspartate 1-decarboxylase